jgi:hypothetical protein
VVSAPAKSILAFFLRHGGLGMALYSFFDETGTHAGHPLTAVGGFLFDDDRVDKFETEWRKRTPDLKEPFHTYDCFGGYEQFEGWPESHRLLLMHDLADIIVKTRFCGILVYVTDDDYKQWCKENPQRVTWIGSAYTSCLMKCIDIGASVAHFSKKNVVNYIFEAGCDKQKEASQFMERLERNPGLKNHLRIGAYGFAPKSQEPALCAADFLCWEWQRNYIEDRTWDLVRSEFKILISPNPTEMYLHKMTKESLSGRATANAIHGIHLDGSKVSTPQQECIG